MRTLKVLFVGVRFYDYLDYIVSALQRTCGSQVDVIVTNPEMNTVHKILYKCTNRNWYIEETKHRQIIEFENLNSCRYDVIFVLLGYWLYLPAFWEFIEVHRESYKVLYLWDSLINAKSNDKVIYDSGNDFLSCFDDIYSFDRLDCERFDFSFLPLFYTDDYIYKQERKKIDFYCVSSLHSGRELLLKHISKHARERKLNVYFKLFTGASNIIKNLFTGNIYSLQYIAYKGISLKDNACLMKTSKITIDIPSPTQNGLSMRSIEALAAHTKLLTTNSDVVNYNFYHPNNIHVISWENPEIPDGFLESSYHSIDEEIVRSYSIDSWVKKILARV